MTEAFIIVEGALEFIDEQGNTIATLASSYRNGPHVRGRARFH
jgi:hypothetical protein